MMLENKDILQSLSFAPAAAAYVYGNETDGQLKGKVLFYRQMNSVLVTAEFTGLPYDTETCAENIYALHIHEGSSCGNGMNGDFHAAGGHYNPGECPHPAHAGDLLPLFSCRGYAFLEFLTDRFNISEIIGKTVIVHAQRDDFTTQPAGDSGGRIGCGVIQRTDY